MTEVASAYVTLLPSFRGGQAAIASELGGPAAAAGVTAGGRAGRGLVSGMLPAVKGLAGPLAAAFAGAKIVGFFKDAVNGASDLNEAASKTMQVFGKDGAEAVNAFARNANTALGQTRLQAVDAAATFGVFGKSAGLGGTQLAGFSTNLVKLTSDMASFSNTSPQDAIEAVSAALRGESEPIRKYGVLLDDATLRQEAMRQGLIKNTKTALTPAQKVLAAQAVIMKQTSDAQGDFARTSGGLANQQRILSAQWTDLKTSIGVAFLPAVTSVVKVLNSSLVPGLRSAYMAVVPFFVALQDGFNGVSEATGASGPLGAVARLGASVKAAFTVISSTVHTFFAQIGTDGSTLQTALGAVRASLPPIIAGVQGVLAAVGSAFQTLMPIVRQIAAVFLQYWPQIKTTISSVFSSVVSIITSALSIIQSQIRGVTAIVSVLWRNGLGKAVLGTVQAVFPAILGIIRGAFNIIAGLFKVLASLMKGDWSGAWAGIKQTLSGALTVITSAIRGTFGTIKALFAGLGRLILNAVGNLGNLLYNLGRDIISGLVRGIKAAAGAVGDAIAGVARGALDRAKGILHVNSPSKVFAKQVGAPIGEGIAVGVLSTRGQVAAAVRRIIPDPTVPRGTAAMTGFAGAAAAAVGGGLSIGTLIAADPLEAARLVERRWRDAVLLNALTTGVG
jgi:phage-related protein